MNVGLHFRGDVSNRYVTLEGAVTVSYQHTLTSASVNCTASAQTGLIAFLPDNGSFMEVSGHSRYYGAIKRDTVPYEVQGTCTTVDGDTVPLNSNNVVPILIAPMQGPVVYGLKGMLPTVETSPGLRVTRDWDFAAVNPTPP